MIGLFGTIRSRVFAALLAISLVPIAALGIQGYHCAMQAVCELAGKHLVAVAEARRTAVANWLEERTKSIEMLASLPTTVDLLKRRFEAGSAGARDTATVQSLTGLAQELIDTFRIRDDCFGDITFYDTEWNSIAQTKEPGHTDRALADAELRSAVEKTGKTFLGVSHGHAAGDMGLHVGCPVRGSDGQYAGFLVANLDLTKSLTPILQERKGLYKTGKVYIISGDLVILTEPLAGEEVALRKRKVSSSAAKPQPRSYGYDLLVRDTNASRADISNREAIAVSHTEEEATHVSTYADYEGHTVLGAALPVGLEGWRLIAEIDRDEALVWLRVLLVRAVATGLVTCIVVVAIAVWISRLVGRPLKQLMRVAHRIRAGNVEERLEQMDVAEAEEVRRAFNAMLDELREKQDQLVKTTTLAYVGELTSSTVHEMRNPLSSIKMNLQALSRAVEKDGRYRELGEIAVQQVTRLERMLTDLLSFGKPVELHMQPMPFEQLVEATLEVTGDVAARSNVGIDVENHLGGVSLCVDKEQMCRALTNLVGNAMEAMPSGGRITIAAEPIPDLTGDVELSVLDTGPGLSGEALQRSMQPFFTTKSNGTGLGLSNVRKIVELHGGKIAVENRREGGASVRLRLPAKCVKRS